MANFKTLLARSLVRTHDKPSTPETEAIHYVETVETPTIEVVSNFYLTSNAFYFLVPVSFDKTTAVPVVLLNVTVNFTLDAYLYPLVVGNLNLS